SQIIEKIFKFASIKHILNNNQDDQNKMFELLDEISKDLKNYDLEFRIEQLESKFSKDLSESTFNELRELKKQKNIN
ncbi:DNA primase, partial [Candidatus Pelagibacter sp.]|nr:DNA primase [Candidatus Pelagibacter sp.]